MEFLKEKLPEFYIELKEALEKQKRSEVIEQLSNLTINRFRLDEENNAMYIYVDGVRELNQIEKSLMSVRHKECITLEVPGMIVIDLDNFDRIIGIEVLDRPDIEEKMK